MHVYTGLTITKSILYWSKRVRAFFFFPCNTQDGHFSSRWSKLMQITTALTFSVLYPGRPLSLPMLHRECVTCSLKKCNDFQRDYTLQHWKFSYVNSRFCCSCSLFFGELIVVMHFTKLMKTQLRKYVSYYTFTLT